jgi:hypothetical protein
VIFGNVFPSFVLAMYNSSCHLFLSVGSGLASYRDMTSVLRGEKEIKYSPICEITYMLTADNRKNYDKVTIVPSKISSITCKPSNLVIFSTNN